MRSKRNGRKRGHSRKCGKSLHEGVLREFRVLEFKKIRNLSFYGGEKQREKRGTARSTGRRGWTCGEPGGGPSVGGDRHAASDVARGGPAGTAASEA